MEFLINQLVLYISYQAARLDDLRFQMFLRWLKSHSSAVRSGECNPLENQSQNKENCSDLEKSLVLWFKTLPLSGLIWEYQLVLTELRWWQALDERSLVRISKEENAA